MNGCLTDTSCLQLSSHSLRILVWISTFAGRSPERGGEEVKEGEGEMVRSLTREASMDPPIQGLNLLSTTLVFWTNFTRILYRGTAGVTGHQRGEGRGGGVTYMRSLV